MSIDSFFKKILFFAFQALFLITPLIWTPKMSELFEFPKMLFVYFCTILVVTSWTSLMIVKKKWIFKRTFLDIPILLFLISQVISTITSIDIYTSIFGYYSRFHGGLLSTFSYVILYYAFVSLITKLEAKNLFKSLLIGGILSSLYSFPEHFGASPSCAIIGSGWQASCWIQDVVTRVFGTFGQPNWLAAFLISIIFIPLISLFDEEGNYSFIKKCGKRKKFSKVVWSKLFPVLVFLLFFLVLLFTKSRSALLGFGVGLLVFSVFFLRIQKSRKKAIYTLMGAFLLVFLSYLSFGKGVVVQIDKYLFPTKKVQQIELVEPTEPKVKVGTVLDSGGTESGEIRKIVWKGALEVFKNNPVFGTGVETFAYSYYNYRPVEHNLVSEWDFLYNKAHNEWLNLLANSGAVGLLSYLTIMAVFITYSIRIILDKNYTNKDKLIALALMSGYISLAISNFFGFSTVVVGYLFFLFPGFLLLLTDSVVNEDEEYGTEILDNFSSAIVFVVLIGSLFSMYKIYTIYLADKAYASGKTANAQEDIQLSLQLLDKAIKYQKNEPVYTDEFSKVAANAALSLYVQNQATAAAELSSLAIQVSNKTLEQNNVHLNFYKSRAKILANLGKFNPQLLPVSADVMRHSIELSPTDPKLYFSLGLILNEQNMTQEALEYVEKSIELKSNYELARYTLGEMYQQIGENDKAIEQYEYILKYISPNNSKVKTELNKLVK